METAGWNPWHGCRRLSEGCRHCYVYRMDKRYEKDSTEVKKNKDFDLPVRRKRDGSYKLPSGILVYTCFTSDFLLAEADGWRTEAWEMMRSRPDLKFLFITKRIDRLERCIPPDWGSGYPNVEICCTTENQDRADYRLPIYLNVPIVKKSIICEPLLGPIDLTPYLTSEITQVIAGGESGLEARVCNYEWVLSLAQQCRDKNVNFYFKQTGARLLKDGRLYNVPRKFQHSQARKAGIDFKSV